MISLKLTDRERGLIHLWIENMREDAGHWGDGAVVFPEEARIEQKLDASVPEPAFTREQLELVVSWALTCSISNEEKLLIGRIENALKQNP